MSSKTGPTQQQHGHGHGRVLKREDVKKLEEDAAMDKAKIQTLENDLARRQESYIRRERAYKTRIDELESSLNDLKTGKTSWMKDDKNMCELKNMHEFILGNVEMVQDRTAKILQEQERDLLRAFRARLFDVQTELEKEKSKKDDGAGAWIERTRQLEAEVEWAKEMADRLDRVNQNLQKENNRYKAQFKTQEEDRNFLIKQLVTLKKDNARMKQEVDRLEQELSLTKEDVDKMKSSANGNGSNGISLPSPRSSGQNQGGTASMMGRMSDTDNRYKEIIKRLKRCLEVEKRNLRQVRQSFTNEVQNRTELENFIRNCIEDVRKEIAMRQSDMNNSNNNNNKNNHLFHHNNGNGSNSKEVSVDNFTASDRQRSLELLLSQERVISLLYAKAFPVKNQDNTLPAVDGETDSTMLDSEKVSDLLPGGGGGGGGSPPTKQQVVTPAF